MGVQCEKSGINTEDNTGTYIAKKFFIDFIVVYYVMSLGVKIDWSSGRTPQEMLGDLKVCISISTVFKMCINSAQTTYPLRTLYSFYCQTNEYAQPLTCSTGEPNWFGKNEYTRAH